ncbi:response regulator transcription factor [Rubeoparvulum massiliense]|uniref:response regulator transcription factor n=1 Tax=Rubeoparvulum massiliense TaxID=1631346 RepID=UPI00065DF2D4|nr:response regulator transcription factor [Rubeoparvulum massiliense]
MPKVLVVDDEARIVEMIQEYLISEGMDVISTTNSLQVMELQKQEAPDILVLDLMMPEKSGMEILREIRQTSNLPIILLTAKAEELDKLLGLELGADDYITKPFSLRELAARIRVILRRSGNVAPLPNEEYLQVGELRINLDKMEVWCKENPIELTKTEFTILETLAHHPGRVYTRLQLLEALGEDYWGYERTLDTHISNLRKKIEDDPSHPAFIKTVYGIGYKMGVENHDA